MLAAEMAILKEEGFNIGLTGFSDEEIGAILGSQPGEGQSSSEYTHKIDAPVYTPKGEKPPVTDLVNSERAEKLISEIESAKLPKEIERFLKTAAARHVVFDYEKIAEFYCHADPKTQELMENSALIIIDFNKALQLGYVKLKEDILGVIEPENKIPEDE
jgi:hypothetical protein